MIASGCDLVFVAGEEDIEAHAANALSHKPSSFFVASMTLYMFWLKQKASVSIEVVLAASSASFCTFLRQNPSFAPWEDES